MGQHFLRRDTLAFSRWPRAGALCALATMHGKEAAIGPILSESFSLISRTVRGIDTDRFGTFSHDITRQGDQLQAARAKVMRGFELMPTASIGIASEGGFGPAPFGLVPMAREVVLLVDRESGYELVGHDTSLDTNFSHVVVDRPEEAMAFARRISFPDHGLIVVGWESEKPAAQAFLYKEARTEEALAHAISRALHVCGRALVETDMRAHRNPTRMRGIERATRDLVRVMRSRCPSCEAPGFDVAEVVRGLPCGRCGSPTQTAVEEILRCRPCGHERRQPATPETTADPSRCEYCNP
jgi:hypothetical protein